MLQPVSNPVLQQYNTRHISIGADGKLWLSTDNGLLCYDGNDVKVFQHDGNNPSSVNSNNIFKTFPDAKGNLYVINDLHESNLSFMDGKTGNFTPVYIAHQAEDFRRMATPFAYTDLLFDDDGSIWLSAYYIGFFHWNKNLTNSYHLNKEYSGKSTVRCIKKDIANKNILWLGTEDGIYSFNKKTEKLSRTFRAINPADSTSADLQITDMDVYSSDSIWFTATEKGIGCYDIRTGYYKIYPPVNNKENKLTNLSGIKQLQKMNKNEYFIATENSPPRVFNINTHEYNFSAFTLQNIPSVQLNYFLADNIGNLWCVLYNRLFRAESKQNKFKTVKINTGSTSTSFHHGFKAVVWDKKRKIYYLAFEQAKEILVLDSNYKITRTIPVNYINTTDTLDYTGINDLVLDKKGRLWMCSNSLYVYDKVSKKMVPSNRIHPDLSFHNEYFQNIVTRGDYIYLQPSNFSCRAIYRFNINTFASDSIPLPDEIAKDKNNEYQPVKLLNYLVLDKKGENAYIGYSKYALSGYTDCLIQLNLKIKKARRVVRVEGVDHNESSNLFKYALDDSDRIWVETNGSIMIYNPGDLKITNKIGTDAEPFSTQLYNIEGKGIMCRLYSQGIMLYDYSNNNQIHLTLNDGLISNSNFGIACTNNKLLVGASDYVQYLPLASATSKKKVRSCYLASILLFNQSYTTDTLPAYLHTLNLPHDKNFITLTFSSLEFAQAERLSYRFKLDGIDKEWIYVNYLNRTISYNNLEPGKYLFHAQVKNPDGQWSYQDVHLIISIAPAWWQTNMFDILSVLSFIIAIYLFVRLRVNSIRKQEQLKVKHEKELLELEAKALRAQMNPHFIFNCINSIKSLIQKGEQEKSILYLTTFSKLIRTVFENSDKREVSLFSEIETCRLYTQLESMRFSNKFNYEFCIDPELDLKSVMVPALIIQPFIENAIWHGIMPKEEGGIVSISIDKSDYNIRCIIDDDGIGREVSKQNKFLSRDLSHQSKGERLTQARLNLDNLLNERNAVIEIIDKYDANNNPCGTTIIISFNEY